LLASFEKVLPLRKASNLAQKNIAHFYLNRIQRPDRRRFKVIDEAVEMAIRNPNECITLDILEHVAHRSV